VPVRILSFEALYPRAEDSYRRPAVRTFAAELRGRYDRLLAEARSGSVSPGPRPAPSAPAGGDSGGLFDGLEAADAPLIAPEGGAGAGADGGEGVDVLQVFKERAIQALKDNSEFKRSIATPGGIPWGTVLGILKNALPDSMRDRDEVAKGLVPDAISRILGGPREVAWKTERRDTARKPVVLFIIRVTAGP